MNWEELSGKWNQVKGSVKQRWGQLTDDDLTYISGTKDRLIGRLQEKYGMTKEEAMRQAEDWFRTQKAA